MSSNYERLDAGGKGNVFRPKVLPECAFSNLCWVPTILFILIIMLFVFHTDSLLPELNLHVSRTPENRITLYNDSSNRLHPRNQEHEPCLEGYLFLNHTGFCYKLHQTPSTFEMAEKTCQMENNGHLSSVNSLDEYLMIIGIYHAGMNKTHSNYHQLWIGMEKRKDESWKWTDGTSNKYIPLEIASDNNENGSFAYIQPFLFDWRTTDEKLRKFICKYKSENYFSNRKEIPTPCENGYTRFQYNDQCYKVIPTPVTLENVESYCQSDSAEIPIVSSEIEKLFLIGLTISKTAENRYYQLNEHYDRIWAFKGNYNDVNSIEIKSGEWQIGYEKAVGVCRKS